MHLNNSITLFVFLFVLILGCSEEKAPKDNSSKKSTPIVVVKDTLTPGVIFKDLSCRKEPSVTFGAYLPSDYDTIQKWPVVVFFDAHARVGLILEKFREIVEKQGVILVVSGDSKNGLPLDISYSIGCSLVRDLTERFSIDKNQLYAAGFSGGARAASNLAINNPSIKAVIACSGGFPSDQKEVYGKFDFVGIAGREDFNYAELENLDQNLEILNFTHDLLLFNGGHDLPEPEIFEQALLLLEMNRIRTNTIERNDSVISNFKTAFIEASEKSLKQKHYQEAYSYREIMLKKLDGLEDVSALKKETVELEAKKEYQDEKSRSAEVMAKEKQEMQRFFQAFFSETVDWWKKEIGALEKTSNTDQDFLVRSSANRILGYISLLCYSHADNALSTGQIGMAGKFLDIYYCVDPENPDCSYLWSCFHTLKGNYNPALGVLEKAIELGFSDAEKLKNDTRLDSLRKYEEFDRINSMVK